MKHLYYLAPLFLFLFFANSAFAQRIEEKRLDTQARAVDAVSSVYVLPLTVKVDIVKTPGAEQNGRIKNTIHLSKEEANVSLRGDITNIRSYGIFLTAEKFNVDVIVAPTFIYQTSPDGSGYDLTIVGYPGNFYDWQPATKDDYEWIRLDQSRAGGREKEIEPIQKKK